MWDCQLLVRVWLPEGIDKEVWYKLKCKGNITSNIWVFCLPNLSFHFLGWWMEGFPSWNVLIPTVLDTMTLYKHQPTGAFERSMLHRITLILRKGDVCGRTQQMFELFHHLKDETERQKWGLEDNFPMSPYPNWIWWYCPILVNPGSVSYMCDVFSWVFQHKGFAWM